MALVSDYATSHKPRTCPKEGLQDHLSNYSRKKGNPEIANVNFIWKQQKHLQGVNRNDSINFDRVTIGKRLVISVVNPKRVFYVGDTLSVKIVARDTKDRPKIYGGDFLRAKLFSRVPVNASTAGRITDYGNGTYVARFFLSWPGNLSVSVQMIHSSEAVQVLTKIRDNTRRIMACGFSDEGRNMTEWMPCSNTANRSMNLRDVCDFSKPFINATFYCQRPTLSRCDSIADCHRDRMKTSSLQNHLVNLDERKLLLRPPGQRVADCAPIDMYTENLDYLQTKTKATGTLLTGDYNAHHNEWLLSKKTDPPGLKKGSKSWWWTAKRLMGQGDKSDIPLLSSENQSYIQAEEKAECFANIFAEKSTIPQDENDKDVPHTERRTTSNLTKIVFWPKQVRKVLAKLDISKATVPDTIPARVLKHVAPELCKPLAKLFRLLMENHYMPKQWKVAHVIPGHKKNNKHDPNNYRPILLLCIISKVMESIINKALWKHINKNILLSDKQFGFRAGHSTADALTYVTQHLHDAKDKRQESRLICLDISRAFDRVWHSRLIAKLKVIGVDGNVLKWIENYLTDRELRVTVGVSNRTNGKPLPLCAPGLPETPSEGYWFNGTWYSLKCQSRKFPSVRSVFGCLQNKSVLFFGDSTIRQWWKFLMNLPKLPQTGRAAYHAAAVYGIYNTTLEFTFHHFPRNNDQINLQFKMHHYLAERIDGIKGGPNAVLVLGLWGHYTAEHIETFRSRLYGIRYAIERLHSRYPDTKVIWRTSNTRDHHRWFHFVENSDWYAYQLLLEAKKIFKGLNIAIIDVWEMTSCMWHDPVMHAPEDVVRNQVDLLLSYICPL
ncbi:PREDICTED: uncharacterized protein LOC109477686 [Branchiostoma belcheri]|uniref:Uncharacterized protein LOC109477686 n=1 Tax=Branchiostoma belcheri TaxID=7741 RepID=A0A6P4YZ61_BRABE|nr:PREDICTED: uncharacterized protein LOC109477686 [Branchiostoma belcheri]